MPDPVRKVQRGQKLSQGLTAAAWNLLLDGLKNGAETGADDVTGIVDPANTALIVSDADRPAFAILGYGAPVRTPAVNPFIASGRPIFASAAPARSKPFAITLKPVKSGAAVKAAVSGVVAAYVNVTASSHTRARAITGDTTKLESCSSGGVPILSPITTTGEQWAMVLLDFGDSGKPSADCSRINGIIRPGFCGTLTQVSAVGACSCVANGSVDLTWDDDADAAVSPTDDPIYGCPPGVVTTICADNGLNTGAPKKWRVTVTGFTGDYTSWNQTYTPTWTSGEVWSQTKNGITITMTRTVSGWDMTLTDGETTAEYSTAMAFCCQELTFDLDDAGDTTGAPEELTATPVTQCGLGTQYRAYLDLCDTDCSGPVARLRFVPLSGSGARSIVLTPTGCGTDSDDKPFMEFSTSDAIFCTGEDGEACEGNEVVFRVTCAECSICSCDEDGVPWAGPGWYCVSGGGESGCVYLETEPDPGEGRFLCHGPFDGEIECETHVTVLCDCGDDDDDVAVLPRRMCLSVELVSGDDCLCLDGFKTTVVYGATTPASSSPFPASPTWGYSGTGSACGDADPVIGAYLSLGTAETCPSVFAGVVGGTAGLVIWRVGVQVTDPELGVPVCVLGDGGSLQGDWVYDPGEAPASCSATTYRITITPSDEDCETDPPPQSFNLTDPDDCLCEDPGDGSGEYPTLAECQEACIGGGGGTDCCLSELESHPDLEVTLSGAGAYFGPAGTYTAVWDAGIVTSLSGLVGNGAWVIDDVFGGTLDVYAVVYSDVEGNCFIMFQREDWAISGPTAGGDVTCLPFSGSASYAACEACAVQTLSAAVA